MKLSWDLLKKIFIQEQVVNDNIDQILHNLTMAGIELESKTVLSPNFTGVVLGKIVEFGKHPDADSLSLCKVDVGSGELLSIVCGAPNAVTAYEKGMLVPVATIGAVLPGDFKITARKLRGIESQGMICSISELGLSEISVAHLNSLAKEDGIWLVQKYHQELLGMNVLHYLGFQDAAGMPDSIVEFKITPNRGDCLSYLGIAREIAILGIDQHHSELELHNDYAQITHDYLTYQGVLLEHRVYYLLGLENIVSELNLKVASLLTMLITGEYLFTSDSKETPAPVAYRIDRVMSPNSATKPVLLELLNIFGLESANFEESKINTPNKVIKLHYKSMINYIGDHIAWDRFKQIISKVGKIINIDEIDSDYIVDFRANSFRPDLQTEQDLVEEVVRIYGYDKIKAKLPKISINPVNDKSKSKDFNLMMNLKQKMVEYGFFETINYSFINDQLDSHFPSKMKLQNGIANLNNLRATLLPSLISVAQYNMKHGISSIRIFELARVYLAEPESANAKDLSYDVNNEQPFYLSGLVYGQFNGNNYTITSSKEINQKNRLFEFLDLKHIVQNVLNIDSNAVSYIPVVDENTYLVTNSSAEIIYNHQGKQHKIGYIGRLHPQYTQEYDLKHSVFVFEINVHLLQKFARSKSVVQKVNKEPLIIKDLSFIVPNLVIYQQISDCIKSVSADMDLLNYRLFDIYYDSDKLPAASYAVAIRFTFIQANDIDEKLAKIRNNLTNLNVIVR